MMRKMFRIAFLQCQMVKELPHMNMPLFVEDILKLGCSFECICASRAKLEDLIEDLKPKRFDLIALDYTFPILFIKELKAIFPKASFVTGGNGFLDTFLKSKIDFAVIGAGRQSFLQLVKALKSKRDLSKIPNLFFKTGINNKTVIDYSGINQQFDLRRELFPYQPFLKWRYVGFTRRDEIVDPPPIVAEFGCSYRLRKLNPQYDHLRLALPRRYTFSRKAKKRIRELFEERMGGCSFCTCPGKNVFLPVKETVDCLIEQASFLQKNYGFKSFVIGSENPFRFLKPLISRLIQENVKLKMLAIRSRVDWVNQNENLLIDVLKAAKKHDFKISLQQLGFESLLQSDLDVYNKGYKIEQNHKVVELIRKLKGIYPRNFQDGGHGFIGINPWITSDELKKYAESAVNMQELFDSFDFGNGLILYDSCLPIYQKLKKEGLLVEHKSDLDSWRFKDKNIVRFINDFHNKLGDRNRGTQY